MDDLSWTPSREFWVLVGFHLFIVLMLVLDLGYLRRRAHIVALKEALIWSAGWVALAVAFAVGLWQFWPQIHPEDPEHGAAKAVEFITGYLVELSLSVDNLFVFLVIFRFFSVPPHLRHRVLFWGILGAILMRASFILVGAALLKAFHVTVYVFGVVLIYTGFRLATSVEAEIDPSKNWLLGLARRYLPIVENYESNRFWLRRNGRWHATPLFLVLLVVESTDVLFAVDSIPAVFGITKDTFIVYTSNIFAILGLRALYFLLAGVLGMFRYLNVGLAVVLMFVGVKMLVEQPLSRYLESYGIEQRHMILISLGVIVAVLGTAVAASILIRPKESATPPAEELLEGATEPLEQK